MGTGAHAAESWADEAGDGASRPAPDDAALPDRRSDSGWADRPLEAPPASPSSGELIAPLLLTLLGLVWLGAIGWAMATSKRVIPLGLMEIISWIGMASGPIAVMGIFYLLLLRTSRREGRRFGRTARAMAAQADYLERVSADLSARVDEHSRMLSRHAEQLLGQGAHAAERLAEISAAVRDETAMLARHSARLSAAAAAARGDMNALMDDLPNAEARTQGMAADLRGASAEVEAQATRLDERIGRLTDSGRAAGDTAAEVAERLEAQLEELARAGERSGSRLDDLAAEMTRRMDDALDRSARSVEEVRKSVEAQGSAMLALVDQARATIDRAGAEAARALHDRIEELTAKVDNLAGKLSAQEAASFTLIGNIDRAFGEVETRLTALSDTGETRTTALGQSIAALGDQVDTMSAALAQSGEVADSLIERAGRLAAALSACAREVADDLTSALVGLEAQASQSQAALAAAAPAAADLEARAASTVDRLSAGDELIARQTAAVSALGEAAAVQLAAAREQAETLAAFMADADRDARALAESAGPQLIEALLRVRETAVQAAERARETLAGVIPQAAEALANASGEALDQALVGQVEHRIQAVTATAQAAVDAAGAATGPRARVLQAINETAVTIHSRIEESKDELGQQTRDNLSRRVALLVESLNSTAIDVTKILSNDVTDTAWAAYLRGDRGVFTRRAVRLIDAGEAREILRHYEAEPEFRDQVNRYVHDFEAMLRQVLASRDGAPLGVTLLSSDMGKLYVALAQAIERLRN